MHNKNNKPSRLQHFIDPILKRLDLPEPMNGLESDLKMYKVIPFWVKMLFLLTNIPYWIIGISSMMHEEIGHQTRYEMLEGLCSMPEFYCVLAICIAAVSTLMHAAQMRIGFGCSCVDDAFHSPPSQHWLKQIDTCTATTGVFACIVCHDFQVAYPVIVGLPLFLTAVFAKRYGYYMTYVIVHGMWHFVTAAMVWNVVMPPVSDLFNEYVLSFALSASGFNVTWTNHFKGDLQEL